MQKAQNSFKNMILEGPNCCGGAGNFYQPESNMLNNALGFIKNYKVEADITAKHTCIMPGEKVLYIGSDLNEYYPTLASNKSTKANVFFIDCLDDAEVKDNAHKTTFPSANFPSGKPENILIEDNTCDTIVSFYLLRKVADISKVLSELKRTLRTKGQIYFSEFVSFGNLPHTIKKESDLYLNYCYGSIEKYDYLNMLKVHGFSNIEILTESKFELPYDLLKNHLTNDERVEFKNSALGMYNIILKATK